MNRIAIAFMIGLGLSGCRTAADQPTGPDERTTSSARSSEVIEANVVSDTVPGPAQSESSVGNRRNTLVLSEQDRDFVVRASNGLTFMVESARLAQPRGASASNREFAQMVDGEYTKTIQKLSGIVRNRGGSLVTGMTRDQYNSLDDLRKLDGSDFDRRFHALQVKGHDGAFKLFERGKQMLDDDDLRALASELATVVYWKLQDLEHRL
jgi:putative membrane protein